MKRNYLVKCHVKNASASWKPISCGCKIPLWFKIMLFATKRCRFLCNRLVLSKMLGRVYNFPVTIFVQLLASQISNILKSSHISEFKTVWEQSVLTLQGLSFTFLLCFDFYFSWPLITSRMPPFYCPKVSWGFIPFLKVNQCKFS